MPNTISHPRRQALIEIILILAVFAIQGGWPIPDNNEAYYLGKATHYWNPDWLSGDFFLETADAHTVFYFTFGWLSIWLSPVALACLGRAVCWSLLAWGWRRLSFAAVPRPWWSVLTAALFVGLLERFHMAGEWVVGGVEAKPFAYALVFFGLSSILHNRWNRGLLFFGAAGAFHPLVGGWSAVAAGFAWMCLSHKMFYERGATAGLSSSVGNIPGKITAGLSSSVGNIPGKITAGLSSSVGNIPGKITAGLSSSVGNIPGKITAGLSSSVGNIPGKITAGLSSSVGNIPGKITAGLSSSVGNIPGKITAGLSSSVGNIPGKITAGQASSGTQAGFGATNGRGFMMPPLRSLWPGIFGGIVLALPGVIPSLMLDLGADADSARQAHLLYVFERLPHHLALSGMHREFILRIALLACFWILLGIWRRRITLPGDFHGPLNILRGFVGGTIAIALAGAAIHLLIPFDEGLAAGLLRFYWFRLLDVVLPLGAAIEAVAIISGLFGRVPLPACPAVPVHKSREYTAGQAGSGTPRSTDVQYPETLSAFWPRCWLALAIVLAAFHVGDRAIDRIAPVPPRTHKLAGNKDGSTRKADFDDWLAACRWVKNSGEIPPDAMFISPRLSRTFRWYADRREVVVWKDVPQSAAGIVEWWRRVQDIHGTGLPEVYPSWHEPLAASGVDHLQRIAEQYKADYLITDRTEPPLDLPVLYHNYTYIVYKLK